ncbi:unnamed protein product [Paramecium primaurelia]|uniref:Uncharacterized protein n=1 Tax=Paramecium primaurelia TaxID=5886 RepID=A0A8S1KNR6_PARPR|nr:unnamed protein product [Paramecium primaurelia]
MVALDQLICTLNIETKTNSVIQEQVLIILFPQSLCIIYDSQPFNDLSVEILKDKQI